MKSILFVIFVMACLVAVHGGNLDLLKNDKSKAEKRIISNELDIGKHSITITADKASDVSRSRIQMMFTTNGFPRWYTKFFSKSGDAMEKVRYRVGFFKLVEFIDDGSRSAFNHSSIVNTWKLTGSGNNVGWSNIQVSTGASKENPTVSITTFSTSAQNVVSGTNPSLTLSFSIPTEQLIRSSNASLSPNALKLDVQIQDWNWQFPGTKLALIAGVLSSATITKFDVNPSPDSVFDEEAITLNNDNDMHFSWLKSVQIKSSSNSAYTTVPVTSYRLFSESEFSDTDVTTSSTFEDERQSSESHRIIACVFDTTTHPQEIFWDPTTSMSGSLATAAVSFTALLAAIMLTLAAQRL